MKPLKLSPLHHAQASLGASFTEFHGWQVADRFLPPNSEVKCAQDGVGLADVSWMGKADIKGEGSSSDSAEWTKKLVELGVEQVWPLARGHWLATITAENSAEILERVGNVVRTSPCLHVTDVSSVFAALLLAGPRSRDVLNKLTELDVSDSKLPNLFCAQTGLAHVHTVVLRQDIGNLPAFILLLDRSYGESVWEAIMEAGEEFGIAPVGLSAVKLLHQAS